MLVEPKPFRILSLDGGGSWALIQAHALADLYGMQARGLDILSRFDLVAANSAGSLVLGGMIKNMTMADIVRLFGDQATRERLFSALGLAYVVDRLLQATLGLGPKYSTERKYDGIRRILGPVGDRPLDALAETSGARLPHLLICGFDYGRQRATFFRSDRDSLADGLPAPSAPTLAQAIHASTNAPVNYFDRPATFDGNRDYAGRRYWDGAIGGYNNPVHAAVVEALANRCRYRCSADTICALSNGTGAVNLPAPGVHPATSPVLEAAPAAPCPLHDARELATSIISDPPDAASFAAHVILGGEMSTSAQNPVTNGRLIRLNPVVQPVLDRHGASAVWTLPQGISETVFSRLSVLDIDAVEQDEVDLIGTLAAAWVKDAVPNQAIRFDRDCQPLIGHGRYSAAKAAWLRLAAGPTRRRATCP